MKTLKYVALAAAMCCALPVMAIEGPAAFVPSQAGATYPGTTTATSAWKLVGELGASAVQISPRWVLTAEHVTGSGTAVVGRTFTNAYGSAVIDAVYPASAATRPAGVAAADLSLVHLASDIVVPANELPALLADQQVDETNNLPGKILAAGRGGFGVVKASWLSASEDITIQMPASVEGVYAIGGDSGSGVFWYPAASSRPVLRSITTTAGNPVGPFSAQVGTSSIANRFDAQAWIKATTSGFGANTGAAPLWASSTTLAPLSARTPAIPLTPRIHQTFNNGAWLDWTSKPAAAGTPATTSYLVRVSPGGAQFTVQGLGNITLTGLSPNTVYSATVEAVNSNGASGRRTALTDPDSVNGQSSTFTTNVPPNALTAFTYEAYTKISGGVVSGCVRLNPTFATTGVAATALGVTNYQKGNTSLLLGLGVPAFDYCDLTPGSNAIFFVAPWKNLSPGPSKTVNVSVPLTVTGVPLDLVTSGRVLTRNATKYYYFDAAWTAPHQPQPTATLQGYSMFVGCNNEAGAQTLNLTVPLPANTTSWSISGVPAGGKCTTILTANWSRQLPINYTTGSAVIPK